MLDAPARFDVAVEPEAPGALSRTFRIRGASTRGQAVACEYHLRATDQASYLDLFAELAADFGTRVPASRIPAPAARDVPGVRALLTEPASPGVFYGYGDPCVLRLDTGEWILVVTSNDAPDAFPILRSDDMEHWRHAGFVFPRGSAPEWALTGAEVSDFWAPELHRVRDEYWLVFAARERDRSLAVGLATARSPDGPFVAQPRPLVQGGVIDPHLVVDDTGAPWLFWKRDDNDLWPRLLCESLHARGGAERLFPEEADRRTVLLLQALWPWLRTLEPMEQFFVQQPLIEAVTSEFSGFARRLRAHADDPHARAILEALRTRIHAQRLAADGSSLLGEPTVVLENDQPWEAHLIEGVWVTPHAGRWYMLYAGNDFSTPHYGIGVAVADHLLGPYRKKPEPLLRTTRSWSGPGHPSVAAGPDGGPRMFFHAFAPGTAAYKAFRALLTCRITFDGEDVRIG